MALALLATVVAHGSRETHQPPSNPSRNVAAAPPHSPRPDVPFDVQAVIRRAHFSFRREDGRFTGGHSSYAVAVDARTFRVSPIHAATLPEPPRDPSSSRAHRPEPPEKAKVGNPLILATTSIGRGRTALRTPEAASVDADGRLLRRGSAVEEILENKPDGVELSWTFPTKPAGEGDVEVRVAASGLDYAEVTTRGLHFRDRASSLGIRFGHATWIDASGTRTDVAARWDGGAIVMTVPARAVESASYPAVLDPILGPETTLDSPVTGPASGGQQNPSAAYDPATGVYFVAWSDTRSMASFQVFGTRVSPGGAVLDPNGILLNAPGVYSYGPSVVFDGTNFLVVFSATVGNGRTVARRVSPSGVLVDAAPFDINNNPAGQFAATAATDGSITLVTWYDYRSGSADIYGARVQGASILDGVSTGFPISTATGPQYSPRVTFGAGNFLVVWEDQRSGGSDVFGTRVSASAAVLDGVATGIALAAVPGSDQTAPWPASNGSGYFVAWQDTRNTATAGNDIYGTRVSAAGVVSDPAGIQICNNVNHQYTPSVAFGGGNYQVVWQEGNRTGLYGNRVTTAGLLLDGPAGAQIASTPLVNVRVSSPQISAAGAGFYLAWSEFPTPESLGGDVFGSRMTPTPPSLVDGAGVGLASSGNGQHYSAVAADAANYLVVWMDDRGGSRAIYGARVDGATGASLDPAGLLLSAGGFLEGAPAVAFNGTQYLVVWQDLRPPYGIYGTRVTTTGTVVDPAGLGLFVSPTNQPTVPAITSDGTNWFVAWLDGRNTGFSSYDVYGGRVDPTGVALDPAGILIANALRFQFTPTVAFGGGFYLVAWPDFRSGTDYDIYGARVSSGGVVQEPAGTNIPIAVGPANADTNRFGAAYASPNFVVVYGEDGSLRRARVASATGAVVDVSPLTGCCNFAPVIANDLDTFTVLYLASTGGIGNQVKGTRINGAGVDIDPVDWVVQTGVPFFSLGLAAVSGGTGKSLATYSLYDATPGVTSDRVRARLLTRAQSDLGVTKTDGQTTAVPGGTVTYTMTVSNAGPDAAIGATVTDTVPVTLSSVTWTCVGAGGGVCPANGTGSIAHTVDVPSGGSVTYTLVGTISPSATGSIANTITVTAPAGWTEANTANNSATDMDTLTPQANLGITKTDGQAATTPGAGIVYTIVASNAGPSSVTGATVADTLPAGTTDASWTCSGSGGGTCAASGSGDVSQPVNLPVGGSVTFTLAANVSPTASGTYSNTATVTVPGGVTDPAPGNNSATDTNTVFPPNNTPGSAKPVLIGSTSSDVIGAAPSDENWFRFGVQAGRSFCVEVDNGKGDTSIRDTILSVYRADGTTIIGDNDDITDEPGGVLLSRVCYVAPASEDNVAQVKAGAGGTPGGIRVRVVETTLFCPWFGPLFSGSGFETFILIKNTTGTVHSATVTLTGAGGAMMGSPQNGTAPANGSYNLQVSAPSPTGFGLSGVSGGVWIAHDGPPGGMIANVTTLDFGSGVSFDTPASPRQDFR